jgi:hypothetical protein
LILEDIANYLLEGGIPSPVYRASMPDKPDAAVCVYEYGGAPPRFLHDGQGWENMRVQALVRDFDYSAGRAKAQSIYDLLNGKANEQVGGDFYLFIGAIQSPFPLGQDEQERYRLAVNFEIVRA